MANADLFLFLPQKMMYQMRRTLLFLIFMFDVRSVVSESQVKLICIVHSGIIFKFVQYISFILFRLYCLFMMVYLLAAVKSKELKWLPHGSEFPLASETSASKSPSKPKTYTSFSSRQDSLPEFSEKPISPCEEDIILAKLGPGQVKGSTCFSLSVFF